MTTLRLDLVPVVVYSGDRVREPRAVTVAGKPLRPRNDLRNHSPDGFEWGYGGSGPAQLALAILADFFWRLNPGPGADERALRFYQDFKFHVIAGLGESWELTGEQVAAALRVIAAVDLS